MFHNFFLYAFISFIIALIIAWIVLSVVLIWFRPIFYNGDGSVNWWTTLWVAALIIIFTWIFMLLLSWIVSIFTNDCELPCEEPVFVKEKGCRY